MNKVQFINEVQDLTHLSTRDQAEEGTMIVLSLLSHRLTPDESKDVASQLQSDLKKLWNSDTWFSNFLSISKHHQLKYRRKEELFAMIRNELDKKQLQIGAEQLAIAVFHMLKEQITEGEVKDIAAQLPDEIEEIWLAA